MIVTDDNEYVISESSVLLPGGGNDLLNLDKKRFDLLRGGIARAMLAPIVFQQKRKRIIDTKRLKWYDTKRCNKQKPSVSHPPPFVAVGRSDMKITTRAFLRGELFCAVNGWMSPVFLLGKIDGGDNDQQGIAR